MSDAVAVTSDARSALTHSGASALVRALEQAGVELVFGLCGHTNVAVLAALEQSGIRFVGVHHEQMASHAADGYARISGNPGVVLTHLGPGMTNAITGVANAALDNVPLVVMTGNVQSYFFGRHAHMETTLHGDADQAAGYAPFCKRIFSVQRVQALLPALSSAMRIAATEPAGPVLIDVAMDVFSEPLDERGSIAAVPIPPSAAVPVPAGLDDRTADAIASILAGARRPVIYAGGGVVRSGAGVQLRALAEALNAPVAYALMGKGAVPDDHPLVVGVSGFWGTPASNEASRGADVLLAVGAEFGELDSSSWQRGTTFAIPPTRLIHIHNDPAEIGRSYAPEIGAVADPAAALAAIAQRLPGRRPERIGLPADLADLRDRFERQVEQERSQERHPTHPGRVVAEVAAALDADAGDILVGDTGWNKNGVAQQVRFDRPDRFVVPGGFATMGFGPAAALGTKLARPQAATVALVGDGAFLTNLSVVVSAVEERIPVVWAVMNNGTYATISGMQRRHFDSDYGSMFDASGLDYVGFARSVGALGRRVESAGDLRGAIEEAIAADRPYVVDIPCGLEHVPTTGHWDINDLFARGLVAE